MSFDCIVPHKAHDKFVSGLTLFLEKWYSHLLWHLMPYVLSDSECRRHEYLVTSAKGG